MEKWIHYRDGQPLLCLPINDHYLQQEEFWQTLNSFVKDKETQRRATQTSGTYTGENDRKNGSCPSHMHTPTSLSQAILLPIALPNEVAAAPNEAEQKNKTAKTTPESLATSKTKGVETTIYQQLVHETIGKIQHIPTQTALIFQTSGTTKAGGHLVGLSWEGIIGAIAAGAYTKNLIFGDPQQPIIRPQTPNGTTQPATDSGLNKTSLSASPLTNTATEIALEQLKHQEWILAIPGQHIGGFLVILRSLLAGKRPHLLSLAEGFSPQKLATLIQQTLTQEKQETSPTSTHISLVPTQIQRCLKNPAALLALKQVSQILVGGAATSQNTQQDIKNAKLNVTYTYGMTETSGGCIYDGQPLPGTAIWLETGRIHLTCPGLMTGYLDEPPSTGLTQTPHTLGNQAIKWLQTNDFGRIVNVNDESSERVNSTIKEPNRLEVIGRIDRVAVSGGKKIPLDIVQKAIDKLEQIQPNHGSFEVHKWAEQLVVTKIPDPDWGEIVVVAATPTKTKAQENQGEPHTDNLKKIGEKLRKTLANQLPKTYLPRAIVIIDRIPLLPNGKIDQLTLEKQVTEATSRSAWIYESTPNR